MQIEHQGVVKLARFAQLRNHLANAQVHTLDHGGVDLHAGRLPGFVLLVPVAHRRRHALCRVDQSQTGSLVPSGLANGLIAAVVTAFLPGDVSRQSVHGPMGRGVGHVHQKWFARLTGGMFAHKTAGVMGYGVGVIVGGRLVFRIVKGRYHDIVTHQRRWIEKAARTVDGAVVTVEPAPERPVVFGPFCPGGTSHMPLAHRAGVVASRLGHLAQGAAGGVQFTRVAGLAQILHHMAHACLMRIQTGQEAGAGGAAAGGVVELTEAQTTRGQFIEVGSTDFPAVAADI